MGSILIKRPNFFPPLIIMFLVTINYDAPNVADFMSYNNIYNSITNKELYQTGYGWYLLNNLGRTLGLDYNHYKMWTIIIAGCCIWMISRILVGKGENFIFGLYLLYPALLDTVQLRFYTAMTIVLIGILFLVKQKNMVDCYLYCICFNGVYYSFINNILCSICVVSYNRQKFR